MSEEPIPQAHPTSLGIYDKPKQGRISGVEIAALALSLLWLIGSAAFFLFGSGAEATVTQGLRFIITLLIVFLPVAMIWVAAIAAKSTRIMREESQRLQAAIDAIRQAYIAQQQGRDLATEPSVTRKLDEIATAARNTETALTTFQTRREGNPLARQRVLNTMQSQSDDQPTLALGTSAEEIAPPLPTEDFIRALNFPETTEDEVGFASLRKALKHRDTAQLVQASQDILTLLSHDGIYMDDLHPDRAKPEVWRQFASGSRGRAIAALGGVRDRSSLALTAGRMKQDQIFRDTAHHFLRKFDVAVSRFAETATDADLTALGDTRTARAFMLLGRVAGTFT